MKTDILPILYILMRTDLTSMNPGKAVAQGAHAANQFAYFMDPKDAMYIMWKDATFAGFGTTITLSVNEAQLNAVDALIRNAKFGVSGIVHDPSYPLVDGDYVHSIPLDTCGYVFGDKRALDVLLGNLGLMK